jgi:hypothetical protein
MLDIKENLNVGDGVFIIKGNVKIYDGDKTILDKDNAITNAFRKVLIQKLYADIFGNTTALNTVTKTGDEPTAYDYISNIKFGRGFSSSLGAKASKEDIALVSAIPDQVSDETTDLYINTNIERDMNIVFDYNNLKIQFIAEIANNDTQTYILGELGLFTNSDLMLTHLFFDPIYFEPNTTKKIVYTIYLY